MGSRVLSRTARPWSSAKVSGAVADCTSSRMATMSHSPGSPSNGRLTKTPAGPSADPWHAL